MGFSISGSAAVILIGVMIATGMAVPTLISAAEEFSTAQSTSTDRAIIAANTDITITNVTYNATVDETTVTVENTGSRSLSVAETDAIADGVYASNSMIIRTAVAGDTETDVWSPDDTLTIQFTGDQQEIKIITDIGVSDRGEQQS